MVVISQDVFDGLFERSLEALELKSRRDGTIDVNLNSQQEVTNFISRLHRQFHYEVCILKERLERQ